MRLAAMSRGTLQDGLHATTFTRPGHLEQLIRWTPTIEQPPT